MKQRNNYGLVVNTGSKQGITMPPGNLTYNVTKAALKTWTEGLEHDFMIERRNDNAKLYSALLVPGWTNTSIQWKELRDRESRGGNRDGTGASSATNGKTTSTTTTTTTTTTSTTIEEMKQKVTHEDNPAKGAWMPKEVFDYMIKKLKENGSFYIICPDNEIDTETDKLRMTWTMQDITEDRPPLSRWHPHWKGEFDKVLMQKKRKRED